MTGLFVLFCEGWARTNSWSLGKPIPRRSPSNPTTAPRICSVTGARTRARLFHRHTVSLDETRPEGYTSAKLGGVGTTGGALIERTNHVGVKRQVRSVPTITLKEATPEEKPRSVLTWQGDGQVSWPSPDGQRSSCSIGPEPTVVSQPAKQISGESWNSACAKAPRLEPLVSQDAKVAGRLRHWLRMSCLRSVNQSRSVR